MYLIFNKYFLVKPLFKTEIKANFSKNILLVRVDAIEKLLRKRNSYQVTYIRYYCK